MSLLVLLKSKVRIIRHVVVWDSAKRKVEYKLGGHNGSVNEVSFSPRDNIIASCASDGVVLLSEIPIK